MTVLVLATVPVYKCLMLTDCLKEQARQKCHGYHNAQQSCA